MKNLLLVSVLIIFTGTLFAQTATPPTVGDGSSDSPYQIATLDNLYWITQNSSSWGSYFIQTADIDASSTSTWDSNQGFSPIGNGTTGFTGSYDGQTYKITNLFINRSTNDNIGLFGLVSSATITNVKLESVKITGNNYVGGFIGQQINSSTATNCHSAGYVTGAGAVGGLIGIQNSSTASACYSNCSVTASDGGVGGLIGDQLTFSTAKNCYSTGSVTGTGSAQVAGGLIGYQDNSSTASACYSSGSVMALRFVGGLFGLQNSSTATNCYSTGSVTGDNEVGGLIGYQYDGSTATNCYCSGSVTGISTVAIGGLIGSQNSATATNCFWDTQTSGQPSSACGTGESTADMKTQSTFTGWDFSTVWEMIGTNYPRLKTIPDPALPVELTSFTATSSNSSTILVWKTVTEVNNYGFEVERRTVSRLSSAADWIKIGFVQGAGTSNAPHSYSFTEQKISSGSFAYRLNQIDNNGVFKYSQEIEVTIVKPMVFALNQNYPNPFNPTTTISFSLPSKLFVSLKIFDLIGREVTTLVFEEMSSGSYSRQWNAANMSSGIYFFRLQAGSFTESKKLVFLR